MRHVIQLCLFTALATGCVHDAAYRSASPAACGDASSEAARVRCSVLREQLNTGEFDAVSANTEDSDTWPYRLAFIEFDDQGRMFDRGQAQSQQPTQLQRALDEIAQAKADGRALQKPPVVALFVHGWKNNASEASGNVWGFRQLLAGLSRQFAEPVRDGTWRAPVVGIYLGWRGAIINAPVVEQFTFWNRKAESQSLPRGEDVVPTVEKIMQAAKGADFSDTSTISVLIGHSFGGAVLEGAVSPTLRKMVMAVEPGGELHAPANLIVFVNEAQEAMRSFDLMEQMSKRLKKQDHCSPIDENGQKRFENPVVLSISSTADYATRLAFPFGQVVNRPFTHLERYPQPNDLGVTSEAGTFYNTTAHRAEFQSHVVEIGTTPAVSTGGRVCTNWLDITSTVGIDYLVAAKPGSTNHSPYWVTHMPPSVVPDHSTIFTPVFRDFLITFLLKTQF